MVMSQGEFVKIDSKDQIEKRLPFLIERIEKWDYAKPLCIKLTPYRNARSISQNKLFHKWCKQISEKFIERTPEASPEAMKLYLKKMFLGIEDVKIGKQIIPDQVKHSSDLDVGEMVHFMDQVYHWGLENKVILAVPEESEYRKLKIKQES